MGLATLKDDLLKFEAAIVSKQPAPILRTAAAVEVDVADVIDLFIPSTVGAAPGGPASAFGSDPDKAACLDCCDRIEAECKKTQAVAVGSWGDGTLFKTFLDSLPAILAIVRDLLKK